ncbi:metallophosphoesterase [Thetidibacter halocola]|uniref:Metallophosphoesterase n=1 Tax=Thetidibacter halocola TaxID=2827239 RepID=A0A8J8B7S1_9RHOB|nr:metallophosphoesterase [Thetidibacter halocola]MBS0123994.1 metallophosphoesterase [Thetidibacter halocola]
MSAKITRYRIEAPGAPAMRVALFADLHACAPYMRVPKIEALVAQTNALGADLVLLLGDYAGHVWGGRSLAPEPVARALGGLRAPLGVFGVFGNHDWRDDPRAKAAGEPTRWHTAFAEAGLTMLCNTARVVETSRGACTLAGLESQQAYKTFWRRWAGGANDLDATLRTCPPGRFTFLMAHEPDIFPDLPDSVGLTVCGHTHGGQILPFGRPLIVPSRYGARYAYGHFREGAKQMIVSGGLGYSGLPLRFGRPPEIVVLEIT